MGHTVGRQRCFVAFELKCSATATQIEPLTRREKTYFRLSVARQLSLRLYSWGPLVSRGEPRGADWMERFGGMVGGSVSLQCRLRQADQLGAPRSPPCGLHAASNPVTGPSASACRPGWLAPHSRGPVSHRRKMARIVTWSLFGPWRLVQSGEWDLTSETMASQWEWFPLFEGCGLYGAPSVERSARVLHHWSDVPRYMLSVLRYSFRVPRHMKPAALRRHRLAAAWRTRLAMASSWRSLELVDLGVSLNGLCAVFTRARHLSSAACCTP